MSLDTQARGDPPHPSGRQVKNLKAEWYYSEDNVTVNLTDEGKKHWMYVYVRDWTSMEVIFEKIRCRKNQTEPKGQYHRRLCVNGTLFIRNATVRDTGYYYKVESPKGGNGSYSDLKDDEKLVFGKTRVFALVVYPETRAEVERQKQLAE
ncbi:unnamed protein product [Cylicocyclus nassatus]|uniref:Uncharacterized protein n=1 Tax=Cylicocyclus nassatus TaxID=53992 RepID=A0AA36GXN6_CYLNA|nr:unnamed protein product [Cylicocyclus nassatus]